MTREDLIYRLSRVLKELGPMDAKGSCDECGRKVKMHACIDLPTAETLLDELERDGLEIRKANS